MTVTKFILKAPQIHHIQADNEQNVLFQIQIDLCILNWIAWGEGIQTCARHSHTYLLTNNHRCEVQTVFHHSFTISRGETTG